MLLIVGAMKVLDLDMDYFVTKTVNGYFHRIYRRNIINLEKMLKKYSMLEISGTEGYQMLKKTSKQKF